VMHLHTRETTSVYGRVGCVDRARGLL
jgi:hypothetical protein